MRTVVFKITRNIILVKKFVKIRDKDLESWID